MREGRDKCDREEQEEKKLLHWRYAMALAHPTLGKKADLSEEEPGHREGGRNSAPGREGRGLTPEGDFRRRRWRGLDPDCPSQVRSTLAPGQCVQDGTESSPDLLPYFSSAGSRITCVTSESLNTETDLSDYFSILPRMVHNITIPDA